MQFVKGRRLQQTQLLYAIDTGAAGAAQIGFSNLHADEEFSGSRVDNQLVPTDGTIIAMRCRQKLNAKKPLQLALERPIYFLRQRLAPYDAGGLWFTAAAQRSRLRFF